MPPGPLEVITDRAALHSYEPQWRALAERRANAFITPEWFWAALASYDDSTAPAVLAARRGDGTLLGLMPLVVTTAGRPRTVRFAGAAHADHLHPVALPDDEEAVASAAVPALGELGARWSVAVLDNVDAGARWWQVLARAPLVVGVVTHRDTVLPAIDLGAGGWEEYLAGRSHNFREQARRYPRRLERSHRVCYRQTADAAELERDMTTFFGLHDARWQARGGSSLGSRAARRFHREFARSALARGWLRLWFLEVDGNAVAAWYGWRLGDRYSYYQAGFDPAWAHLSVGFVLMLHTVRSALAEGASHYDMLLGDEPYKARFTTSKTPVCTVTLSRSRSAHLMTAAEACVWKGSRMLPPGVRAHMPALGDLLPSARRR